MAATVAQILALVDQLAPFELAEVWDNVGLLCGDPAAKVEKILVALDLTPGALAEAGRAGAQLIVTHHPILFHARQTLREDDAEGALLCALARARVALIAAHTNYDNAPCGVNDALAAALGFGVARPLQHGLRLVDCEQTLVSLAALCEQRLGGRARPYGAEKTRVKRLALCGGAGSDFWPEARKAGADCLLTGEVRHHHALEALASGLTLIEAGHYHTERPSVKALGNGLQTAINAIQYNVSVLESGFEPFSSR